MPAQRQPAWWHAWEDRRQIVAVSQGQPSPGSSPTCTASTPVAGGASGPQTAARQCMCSGLYLSILHPPGHNPHQIIQLCILMSSTGPVLRKEDRRTALHTCACRCCPRWQTWAATGSGASQHCGSATGKHSGAAAATGEHSGGMLAETRLLIVEGPEGAKICLPMRITLILLCSACASAWCKQCVHAQAPWGPCPVAKAQLAQGGHQPEDQWVPVLEDLGEPTVALEPQLHVAHALLAAC